MKKVLIPLFIVVAVVGCMSLPKGYDSMSTATVLSMSEAMMQYANTVSPINEEWGCVSYLSLLGYSDYVYCREKGADKDKAAAVTIKEMKAMFNADFPAFKQKYGLYSNMITAILPAYTPTEAEAYMATLLTGVKIAVTPMPEANTPNETENTTI